LLSNTAAMRGKVSVRKRTCRQVLLLLSYTRQGAGASKGVGYGVTGFFFAALVALFRARGRLPPLGNLALDYGLNKQ
jgi:hypothetical protein